ncbi:hypothetical protein JZ751_010111 [Albula glossodonta]|uniref:Ig-like domain-containing protein n=1 Tax=Albula glossodonta TaxID=121402 RepID=A0A8T2N1P1_9TELE|nr:hypothetical protein JZ751_010111 [Albula glossodonta]
MGLWDRETAATIHSAARCCPSPCVCASDIITCSNQNLSDTPTKYFPFISLLDLSYNRIVRLGPNWTTTPLKKLHALIMNHNSISQISPKVFTWVPHLKHLDLSSNRVSSLNTSIFQGLAELEVLMLFNNRMAIVAPTAFDGLKKLQRMYLSQNRLAEFPLRLFVGEFRLPHLEFVDLSNNFIREVPVQSIISLPTWQQAGLYLHHNQLTCDCMLHTMLQVLTPGTHLENLSAYLNGSLCLNHVRLQDSGTYMCVVVNHRQNLNETIKMTVQVRNLSAEWFSASENFHTAFTTLASCVVSIVLVLLYLYLMPCQCRAGRKPTGQGKYLPPPSLLLLDTERRETTRKRVVFLEPPIEHAQNGKTNPISMGTDGTEGILKMRSATT